VKKLIVLCLIGFSLIACTENSRVKGWGGTGKMLLPKGKKLVNVTWKGENVWYLTRAMRPGEVPEVYEFQEESSFGIIEGTYIITEQAK
jgi:hypothetical protein